MDDSQENSSLFFGSVLIAAVWMIVAAFIFSSDMEWYKIQSPVPYYVDLLYSGFESLPKYHYAIAGVIVALGSSLSSQTAKQAIWLSAIGSGFAILLPVVASIWTFTGMGAGISQGVFANGVVGLFVNIIVLITMFMGSLIFCIQRWGLIAIVAILVSIAIHALVDFFTGRHHKEHASTPASDADQSWEWSGIVGSVLACFVAVLLYGFIPGFHQTSALGKTGATPEEIWADLPLSDGDPTFAVDNAKSKKIRNNFVDQIELELRRSLENKCEFKNSSMMISRVNDYFRHLRIYEDWHPKKTLSSISLRAIRLAERGLDSKIIGWYDFKPYTQIHLNRDLYKNAQHIYPDNCPLPH
jgi:hypothetical protein